MEHLRNSRPVLTRRGFIRVGLGASAAVALAACGRGGNGGGAGGELADVDVAREYDGPAVALAFWNGFTGGDGPFLRDLVEQFNAEHDNVDVEMNTLQWADFYSSVPPAVSRGEGPDVAVMHLDQLGTNASRGVILPLDNVTEALDLNAGDFDQAVWDAGMYQDRRYGIPLDVHPLGFYYNKRVMEAAGLDPDSPPTDRDSLMDALDAMRSNDIQGHWVSPFMFTGGLTFQSLAYQFGGQLYNEDASEATFDAAENVEALEWYLSLIEEGHSPSDVGQDAEHVAFTNDNNAFIWNGIWMIQGYGEDDNLDWGVAEVPQIGSERAVWASSHNFVLMNKQNQDENKVRAAAAFVNWISEHSLQWAEAGQIPARASVRESSEFEALEHQPTFANQLEYARFAPPVPGVGDAQGELETAVGEAVLGQKSAEQALADGVARANEVLESAQREA
ncbi:ABC transporter substrate-binding protein [Egicoccus sp. AB-alg6-2]|uniref:ABC transporter substrate-binding protein n=1 Tax=Egicoccus sp. AB-alg6-2 TaxID=3242692 RepID=UPI00359E513D